MHIAVIGSGYVGLVTGACLAEFGDDVTCVDIKQETIERLAKGDLPIYERGLKQLVTKNLQSGRLNFTTDLKAAVQGALVIFLAVGTPPKDDGAADLGYVKKAARSVAEHMNGYKVVVTKSTVPIGTGEELRKLIRDNQKTRTDFGMVSNPEFLREGEAINDFMKPDRVVIGSRDERAIEIMRALYRPLAVAEVPFVFTSLEAAELTKYAANAFLAMKISFINEIANLCDSIGCDVRAVARAVGMDQRIGKLFLHPGPGFGGSCFPKDTLALHSVAKEYDCSSLIVDAVIEVNKNQRQTMLSKIEKLVGGLEGKTIAILGLTFKPETDDMREAPSIDIIKGLLKAGARVQAYDPVAKPQPTDVPPEVLVRDEYEAVTDADAVVFVTEWNQFLTLDMNRIKGLMRSPRIADLRNIYEPADMKKLGFQYVGVGRQAEADSLTQST